MSGLPRVLSTLASQPFFIQQRGQRRGKTYGGVDKVPNLYVFFNVANALAKGQR